MKEFDHPGFLIPNKNGLQLVVSAVRKALHGAFPVEELFRPWENSEGQVSWQHQSSITSVISLSLYVSRLVWPDYFLTV